MRLLVRRRSVLLGILLLAAGLPPATPRLSSHREDTVRVPCGVPSASIRCSLQALVERGVEQLRYSRSILSCTMVIVYEYRTSRLRTTGRKEGTGDHASEIECASLRSRGPGWAHHNNSPSHRSALSRVRHPCSVSRWPRAVWLRRRTLSVVCPASFICFWFVKHVERCGRGRPSLRLSPQVELGWEATSRAQDARGMGEGTQERCSLPILEYSGTRECKPSSPNTTRRRWHSPSIFGPDNCMAFSIAGYVQFYVRDGILQYFGILHTKIDTSIILTRTSYDVPVVF